VGNRPEGIMKGEEEESETRINSFRRRFILLLLNYVEKTNFPLLIHICMYVCVYIYIYIYMLLAGRSRVQFSMRSLDF
jgi:hypothetical protein